jgi:uncharacterized protein (DUF58 family)
MIAAKRLYLLLMATGVLLCFTPFFRELARVAVVIDIVLLIAVIVDYLLTPRSYLLSADREVAERLSIGRANPVLIRVKNVGGSDLLLKLRDSVPDALYPDKREFEFRMGAGSELTFKYALFPTRRGPYELGDIYLRYLSFLGLFWRQTRVPAQIKIRVLSDLKALTDLSIKLSSSTELGELHQRKRGQGTDFASLREYVTGDDPRSIDWKATARRHRPIVRTYEAEQEQKLLVLIDAGRMMVSEVGRLTRFDHALNAGLSLALTGLTYNDQVGFGIFADKPLLYMPARRGKDYFKKIVDATSGVEPRMIEPDYAGMLAHFATLQKTRALFVVLTDLTDPSGSQMLLSGLAHLGKRHLAFCVTLKDRRIQQLAQAPDDGRTTRAGKLDIFKRAVAVDLLQQRELALNVLKKQGCLVLDEAPEELSTRLIDSYLEIKRKALL